MKNLLMILSLITVITMNYSCKKTQEDCVCIEIYDPVCGDDGVLYANKCKADCANISYTVGECPIEVNAKVVDQGPVAADGCGWVLQFEMDGTMKDHHVNDLPAAFKVNQMDVKIEYKPTAEIFTCGLLATEMPIIELVNIQEN